jgi:hypothetical protein
VWLLFSVGTVSVGYHEQTPGRCQPGARGEG